MLHDAITFVRQFWTTYRWLRTPYDARTLDGRVLHHFSWGVGHSLRQAWHESMEGWRKSRAWRAMEDE